MGENTTDESDDGGRKLFLNRRPVLQSIGIGGGAVAGIPGIGRVTGAQDDTEGSEETPYYTQLEEELSAMGLPMGDATFVHGKSETEVRSQYGVDTAGIGDDETEYGTSSDVSSDLSETVPFSEATRITVAQDAEEVDNWAVHMRTAEWYSDADRYPSVAENDVMLGVVYLRSPDGDGTVQYVAEDPSESWNSVVDGDYQNNLTVEWQRYYFPIRFQADANGDQFEWSTQIHLGFGEQTVDVGGLALIDFGQNADANALPSGTVDDSYEYDTGSGEGYAKWPSVEDGSYYHQLVEDLSSRGLEPGQFVYADNEADTFDSYTLANDDASGASTSDTISVDGEDVPFSEAVEIDVTEPSDNAYEINFIGDVTDRDVSSGDVLLGVAYLRALDESGAQVTYKASESENTSSNYTESSTQSPDIGQDWERYYFPIEFGVDGDAGDWWTEFWLGGQAQTVQIGGLALLDFKQGNDVTDLPPLADNGTENDNWEEEAEERIREHRTSTLDVEVIDANGAAVEDANVTVEMQEHDFTFGTAVHAEFLTRGTEWGGEIELDDGWSPDDEDQQQYREVVDEYFNTIVLENLHKWLQWENNQDIADEATRWALDRGKDVRGHVCVWGNVGAWAVPPRVVEAMGDPWASDWEQAGEPDPDPDYVVEESMKHIEEIINYYGDDIYEWEIVNEALPDHATSIIEAVSDDATDPHTAPILGDWYEHADDVRSQYDVDIAVNDYNTLAGGYTSQWEQYEEQIDFLVNDRDIDLDGVGMQSHHFADEQLTTDQMWEAWEQYSQYGPGLRITEFDMFGENWTREEQADYMHQMLKLFFSHPDAEQFLMWGFWDPLHWGQEAGGTRDAPLFERDWTEKPALEEYTGLVFDEWWTEESGTTDDTGLFSVNAFHGEHEVTVEYDGEVETTTVHVDEDDHVTVQLDEEVAEVDCFIATAACGTPDHQHVETLRSFRDDKLRGTLLGDAFIKTYYTTSPPVAEWIASSDRRRKLVRRAIVRPSARIASFFD